MVEIAVVANPHTSVTTLRVCGELDLSTASELDQAVRTALRPPTRAVMVDLEQVTFLDCSTVGLLVRRGQQARRRGLGFGVCRAQGIASTVLDLSGARELLDPGL
jgi:anti-anti-sigma factor